MNFLLLIRILFFFSLILTGGSAIDTNSSTPPNSLPSNVESNEIQTSNGDGKVLFARYSIYPQKVYQNETFDVKIEATILLPNDFQFSLFTDIPESEELEKVTDEIIWYKKEDSKFEATLTFKTKNEPFVFPIIGLSILDANNNIVDKTLLVLDGITFQKLNGDKEYYTSIFASGMSIQNLKVKQYNNQELLCSMEIHGHGTHLKNFRIPKYKNQGIKELVKKDGSEILYYFAIVPINTQSIRFDYFNTIQEKIIEVEVPIILEEDLVSTQTDLNPNEGNIDFYKKIFFAFMATFASMIYYFKRWRITLVFAVIFTVTLLMMLLPNPKLVLQKEEKVFLLPTPKSTVFKVIEEEEVVEVLVDKNGYKKILFQNNTIGWVKDE